MVTAANVVRLAAPAAAAGQVFDKLIGIGKVLLSATTFQIQMIFRICRAVFLAVPNKDTVACSNRIEDMIDFQVHDGIICEAQGRQRYA